MNLGLKLLSYGESFLSSCFQRYTFWGLIPSHMHVIGFPYESSLEWYSNLGPSRIAVFEDFKATVANFAMYFEYILTDSY